MTVHGYYQQLAQERLDYQYEKTPASERPLWPPTYFPTPDRNSSEPVLPLSTGSLSGTAPAPVRAMTEVPPARTGATVPTTTTSKERA